MKILLGDLNAKVEREDIFKPTIGNENLHVISNDNGVRVVNFATSKTLIVINTIFSHSNIHKYTWTSPNGNTHNQIDHNLIDRRRHSSVLDVRSFRAVDCDMDHFIVLARIRERLADNKQGSHKFQMERFNLKKIKEAEGKEKYHVEVSNTFAAFEDLDAGVEINTIWETIRENIKISVEESVGDYELKQHKPWIDEGCSELLD
jgi:hypothetical protein